MRNVLFFPALALIMAIGACSGPGTNQGGEAEKQTAADATIRAKVEACAECLPKGFALSTEFRAPFNKDQGPAQGGIITIRDKLIQLRAYCEKGVLYDKDGKEIRFYRMFES